MSAIAITNHGPLIVTTNYWESEAARAGKIWVSVNAGAVRVILPPPAYGLTGDMRQSSHCVLSRGPWPDAGRDSALEIMWEDGSDDPIALHVGPESVDVFPGPPPPDREWIVSVWVERRGEPHKAMERRAHWRRVDRLPCMRPWEG